MQRQVAREAISLLSKFEEADKIVLFGSVNKGVYTKKADVDVAFICSDNLRWLPLDDESMPSGLMERITANLKNLQESSGIRVHVCLYWSSDYERGIELFSGKNAYPDLLHEVGTVMYDSQRDVAVR
jgi:hypothetical protein